MGISFAAMISMMTTQHREGKYINQQLASASLKYAILQTLKNRDNCLCQLSPYKIDARKTSHTPGNKGYKFTLTEFKNGCGANANVLASADKDIGAGLKVSSVEVLKIKETGTTNPAGVKTEFFGNLMVNYQSDSLIRTIQSVEIPLQFTIDPPSPISARDIVLCGAKADYTDRLNQAEAEISQNKIKAGQDNTLLEQRFNTKIKNLEKRIIAQLDPDFRNRPVSNNNDKPNDKSSDDPQNKGCKIGSTKKLKARWGNGQLIGCRLSWALGTLRGTQQWTLMCVDFTFKGKKRLV